SVAARPAGSSTSLTATSRRRRLSAACRTVPMPPLPMAVRSWYRPPMTVPGTARCAWEGGVGSPCQVEVVVTGRCPSLASASPLSCWVPPRRETQGAADRTLVAYQLDESTYCAVTITQSLEGVAHVHPRILVHSRIPV